LQAVRLPPNSRPEADRTGASSWAVRNAAQQALAADEGRRSPRGLAVALAAEARYVGQALLLARPGAPSSKLSRDPATTDLCDIHTRASCDGFDSNCCGVALVVCDFECTHHVSRRVLDCSACHFDVLGYDAGRTVKSDCISFI
jgi:hypothetical protein